MENVLTVLRQANAIITDSHIIGTSGRHMSVYINKDKLYPHTELSSAVGDMFASKHQSLDIDVVVGPAVGGIVLSQWTAFHLSQITGREVLGVYTEKDAQGNQVFNRGYEQLVVGKRVLVVEDTVTTGGSVKQVVDMVKANGGIVVAASVMVNRDVERINSELIGVPFSALANLPADSYDPNDCPMCKQGVPINTTVGHGKKLAYVQP